MQAEKEKKARRKKWLWRSIALAGLLLALANALNPYWDSLLNWERGSFGQVVLADYQGKDIEFQRIRIQQDGDEPRRAVLSGGDYAAALAYLENLPVKTVLAKKSERPAELFLIRIEGRQKLKEDWATHYGDMTLNLYVIDAQTLLLREEKSAPGQGRPKRITYQVPGGMDLSVFQAYLNGPA